jgi:hypothetical protein
MRTMTRTRGSRGYLLAWLGGVVGLIPAVMLPFGIAQSAGCGPNSVVCGFFGGFIVAGVVVVVAIVAGIVGPVLGAYLALRIAGREGAGLTAWIMVLCVIGLYFVGARVGPYLEGDPLDDAWAFTLVVATVTMPLSARYLALRAANSLRRYR